ncbi:hypothetical protein RAC89_04345 [Paenibacillus sp. GD4]|uniref:YkvI family membrane protein n=1 Tax=Paenibacillus sp. GD4 TaxID=3068890 RepID=UPI0027966E90|nr:hypothetical protein [Paenibacillus sp. GD4]MDQ1909736.1 hypothetical protein [Paenibacillus sp. GD4]
MKKWGSILQVSFTYIGTIVGAGFATGQEILQFFTRYGWMASLTIAIVTFLFIWLGTKVMQLSAELGATSYEDMNRLLFGERLGVWVSHFMLIVLFGVSTVMLAGAGSVFSEQLQMSYQFGLVFTLVLTYLLLMKGMDGIMAINTIVVPVMIVLTAILVGLTMDTPGADNWLHLESDYPLLRVWFAPLLYSAFNLSMAQAVLVPLGAKMKDRSVILWGGIWGGLSIGLMLFAGHFILSSHMPGIASYQIPLGEVVLRMGSSLQLLFVFVIYSEIFTTFLADVYGLSLQIEQRTKLSSSTSILLILLLSYMVSQIGFKSLLSTLYPLFGMFSMGWLVMLIWYRRRTVTPS